MTPRYVLLATLVVGVAAVASIVSLKWLPIPWAGVDLVWAAVAVAAMRAAPRYLRHLASAAAAIAFAFFLAELWFGMTLPAEVVKTFTPAFNSTDPVLGWALRPSQHTRAMANAAGKTLYDVIYTTDAGGHRVTGSADGSGRSGCVFFFADSFAFGEGVEDAESLPHRFDALTKGRFRVVNFGVSGYGAEHMLARIERGDLARGAPCEPMHIVYLALPHHIMRAAGKVRISQAGPRYRLDDRGVPQYQSTSPWSPPPQRSFLAREWDNQVGKSQVRRAFAIRSDAPTDADAALYYAIVSRAFALCASRWPRAERHIVSWDIHPQFANGIERFHGGLALSDAHVHPIDDIVPGYSSDPLRFSVHPLDLHPSAKTHDIVARYLAAHL